ncbi:MAG: polysaccharide deacetylase family protein [Planctomycetota bacterium]
MTTEEPLQPFWPAGIRAALSLSFDDGRWSQTANGFPLLDAHGVKATFYVTPRAVEQKPDPWRRAAANGHELGNHTVTHPCSGNFAWCRKNALEDYTLERLERDEILGANAALERLLGVRPVTFAYPCGQTYVGRGENVCSYVPLVAKHFLVGRGFMGETANDPAFCDLAQVPGIGLDGLTFEEMKTWLDGAVQQGSWLIFAGHDIGAGGRQNTPAGELEKLCRYVKDPANGIWVDTLAAVGKYVKRARHSCEC